MQTMKEAVVGPAEEGNPGTGERASHPDWVPGWGPPSSVGPALLTTWSLGEGNALEWP